MDVSILEQAKIQAQVLVPLLKAFQAELGTERANEIARKALGSWAYKMGKEVGAQGTGTAAQKMAAVLPVFSADDAHDIDVLNRRPRRSSSTSLAAATRSSTKSWASRS